MNFNDKQNFTSVNKLLNDAGYYLIGFSNMKYYEKSYFCRCVLHMLKIKNLRFIGFENRIVYLVLNLFAALNFIFIILQLRDMRTIQKDGIYYYFYYSV